MRQISSFDVCGPMSGGAAVGEVSGKRSLQAHEALRQEAFDNVSRLGATVTLARSFGNVSALRDSVGEFVERRLDFRPRNSRPDLL
jgi:hypothetical protein